jgi:hypothetical protein
VNAQVIFDKVVTHLRTQRQQSRMYETGVGYFCAYRGKHGQQCAAGVCIPDDGYTPTTDYELDCIATEYGLDFTPEAI